MVRNMVVAIDFDGTCVAHDYPFVGKEIGAARIIKELYDNGNKIILYTMRSGEQLKHAVKWFEEIGVKLWGINMNPEQFSWTKSPKPYAEIYIDDAALGCPLTFDPILSKKPFVDWNIAEQILVEKGFLFR